MPDLGSYGVVRTNGWPAWGIRLITRSTVNHAFVHVGGGRIVEARPGGATYGAAAAYPDAVWSHLPLTSKQAADVAAAAESLIGTPYSWVDCAAIGLTDVFGWHVPEAVRKRLNRRDRLMCSQLVDTAYASAGVQMFADGRVPGDCSPADLLALIRP